MDTRTQYELQVTNDKNDPTSRPLVTNHKIHFNQTLDILMINVSKMQKTSTF